MTDYPAQIRFARRFVAKIPGQPDIHGIEFPDSGHVLADVPFTGLTAFLNASVITDDYEGAVIHWADEQQHTEARLSRIEALADQYPVGIDTALIHEALDQQQDQAQ